MVGLYSSLGVFPGWVCVALGGEEVGRGSQNEREGKEEGVRYRDVVPPVGIDEIVKLTGDGALLVEGILPGRLIDG